MTSGKNEIFMFFPKYMKHQLHFNMQRRRQHLFFGIQRQNSNGEKIFFKFSDFYDIHERLSFRIHLNSLFTFHRAYFYKIEKWYSTE